MDFLKEYKLVIIRVVGSLMLVVGFSTHFWTTPKEGLTKNEIASRNIARMEAKSSKSSSSTNTSTKKSSSKYLQEFKSTREKQMKYLTIIAMLIGVGFLGYSFISKKD